MPYRENSRNAIEIHFQEALRLSYQLSDVAAVLQLQGEVKLQETKSQMQAVWKGLGAQILTEKEVRLSVSMTEEARELRRLAEDLEKQAREMYQAELTNYQTAEIRLY